MNRKEETVYIYRESVCELIGPFRSPNEAYEHREVIRDCYEGRKGRPRQFGTIVSAEEAIAIAVRRSSLLRTTPDEDMRISEMRSTEPERAA